MFIQCSQRPEEGVGYSKAGITGHCETPGMGAGIQTSPMKKQ